MGVRMGVTVLVRVFVVVVKVVAVIVVVNRELRGGDTGAQHAGGMDVIARDRERAERAFQFLERQAGVEQRAQHHVARDARKTVEIQQPAHSRPISLKLQYRASPRMT